MMRTVLLFCLLTLTLSLWGQGGKVRIEGKVERAGHVRSVQLVYPNGFILAGPVPIVDGSWSLQCRISQPRLALVSFLSDKPVNHYPDAPVFRYNVPVFLAPGTVGLVTDSLLEGTRVVGSEPTDEYNKLVAAAAPYEQEIQRWRAISADSNIAGDLHRQVYIGRKIDSLTALCRERIYGRFLERNIASPLVPHVLGAYWHLDGEPDRMLRFLVNMPWRYRYPYINAFREELEKAARISAGQAAPDFRMRDTSGREVTLSSFRGRYVLVDFWGSWCLPCRLEAPNLVQAYSYFRGRNLSVLGVAVERSRLEKNVWMKAIREDGLPGTQVSDFRFWDSPLLKKYGVAAIPQNVLIDPNGQIVARNLRGEHLWAVLDRILPK
ncbi:MAG: TlpA family protein disulfide reductase [Chitinophagaceae bacterium]|nr:MAG: TlpA family protein disulfide reductase [Chitinophagaceae bacterium]